MPLFDQFLIVDWSANNTPKRGKDSIWYCLVERHTGILALENPMTRSAAIKAIESICKAALAAGKRLFAGFDFAFGYPEGGAEAISGKADWAAVWQYLARKISDDDANKANRFVVADALNTNNFATVDGPFWGHPHQHTGRYSAFSATRPNYSDVAEKRLVDHLVSGAQPVWKLAYTGSVGSQTLVGIARLEKLRKMFGDQVRIWPFETRFAERLDAPLTVAEIYPTMLVSRAVNSEIKDATQVRVMAEQFCAWDSEDFFEPMLDVTTSVPTVDRETAIREEGWIVGAGHSL